MVASFGVQLPKILLAESDHEMRALLKHALQRVAYVVDECRSSAELRLIVDTSSEYHLMLLAEQLLDASLESSLVGLQRDGRCPRIVLIADRESPAGPHRSGRLRVAAIIERTIDVARNVAMVRRLAPHRL